MYCRDSRKEELIKFLDTVGSWDYAVPQPWFDEVLHTTGVSPYGQVVWMYDEQARTFGRPYAVTLLGHIILKLYSMKGTKKLTSRVCVHDYE